MGCFKRTASKRILSRVKQITSPGRMHEKSSWTWCTGKTYRDRVEREVGGGTRMGNTCKPMAVSFQCMTKSITILKKKIKKKKRKSSNVPRKVSGSVVGSVESVQNQIFPGSSLYLFSKSTVVPEVQSWANCRNLNHCTCHFQGGFPFFPLLTQPLVFCFGFGPTSTCNFLSSVCSLPRMRCVKVAAY